MIYMHTSRHHKPHFHVYFSEYDGDIDIAPEELYAKSIPAQNDRPC